MKGTIDSNGKIYLDVQTMRALDYLSGDTLYLLVYEDKIVIQRYHNKCAYRITTGFDYVQIHPEVWTLLRQQWDKSVEAVKEDGCYKVEMSLNFKKGSIMIPGEVDFFVQNKIFVRQLDRAHHLQIPKEFTDGTRAPFYGKFDDLWLFLSYKNQNDFILRLDEKNQIHIPGQIAQEFKADDRNMEIFYSGYCCFCITPVYP